MSATRVFANLKTLPGHFPLWQLINALEYFVVGALLRNLLARQIGHAGLLRREALHLHAATLEDTVGTILQGRKKCKLGKMGMKHFQGGAGGYIAPQVAKVRLARNAICCEAIQK